LTITDLVDTVLKEGGNMLLIMMLVGVYCLGGAKALGIACLTWVLINFILHILN